MTRLPSALVALLVLIGGAAGGCAHPPPRGPMPATRPGAGPAATSCGEMAAPYLAELCAMGEPPLSVQGTEAYRFVWIKHLRNPVAVRVTRAGAEIAVVAVEGDARNPAAPRRHEFTTGPGVWETLRHHLDLADFWNQAGDPEEGERGLDGADWVIEARRANIYHSVVRWEPKAGPFRDACEDLIRASGLSFPEEIR
jgi:hypothetical protein